MKLTEHLIKIFHRDLNILAKELKDYPSESVLWKTAPGINNSAGNLALHLIGNLNHFIGTILGNTDYIRDREREFTDKDVPLSRILTQIEETQKMIHEVLSRLTPETLEQQYPIMVSNEQNRTDYVLIHLAAHLAYHLGQINYHRRLLGL